MAATALLLPGQGAFYPGVLRDLAERRPEVVGFLAEMDDAPRDLLGVSLTDHLLATPQPMGWWLNEQPELLQVAIVAVNTVTARILMADGLAPQVLVGHSLGEVSALCAGGAFTAAQASELVVHRSLALRAAPRGHMAAVSATLSRVEALLKAFDNDEVAVAVVNGRNQTVISGATAAMDAVCDAAAAMGMPVVRLNSPHPFHHPFLGSVAADLRQRIAHLRPGPLHTPVHSPIEGRSYTGDDDLTARLADHLARPVRFDLAIENLISHGVGTFVEAGALSTLSRLVSRTADEHGIEILSVATLPGFGDETGDWDRALSALGIEQPQTPSLDNLRRLLLPGVNADQFLRFWQQERTRIRDMVSEAYLNHLRRAGTPATVARHSASSALAASAPTAATPAASVSAVSVAAAAPSTTGDPREVFGELVRLYADALEYPVEVFGEETDLEAELGVDSVKQTELLGRVAGVFGLPEWDAGMRMADLGTLGQIRDLVIRAIDTAAAQHDTAPAQHNIAGPPQSAGQPWGTESTVASAAALDRDSQRPDPAAPPGPGGDLNPDQVFGELVRLYADALEYPVEVFGEETDLEAELGVDSVKQTELLGRVAGVFGLPEWDAGMRMADLGTLGQIRDLVIRSGHGSHLSLQGMG